MSTPPSVLQRNKSERIRPWLFVLLLFAVGWLGTIPMVLESRRGAAVGGGVKLLQLLMLFGPGLVAIVAAAANGGKDGVKRLLKGLLVWRAGVTWWVIVLAGPGVLFTLAVLAAAAWSGTPPHFYRFGEAAPHFLATFVTYSLLNTEEIAWRGYLLPRLQARRGAVSAAAIVGVLWSLFHTPLFLVKGGHPAGYDFRIYFLLVFGLSFLMSWLYNNTGASLLLAHLFHQSFNTWAEAVPFFPRVTGNQKGAVVAVFLVLAAAVALVARRKIGPRTA